MAPPSWPIIQPNFRLNSIRVTRVFVWDAENRLVEVRNAAGDATIATYTYDHLSRRIRKTTISGTPQNTTDTTYHYNGWNLIAEYSGATLKKTYLWGMDLSGTIQGAGGVGGLLSVSDHDATTGHVTASYYPTFDGNGNVSEYLNGSGTPVAHYEYDPFGNDITPDSSSLAKNDDFSHRFSTKLLDQETGLYYYGYRYYDPLTGRWPSRDPVGEKGGMNVYGFVGNDGISDFDCLGLIGIVGHLSADYVVIGQKPRIDRDIAQIYMHTNIKACSTGKSEQATTWNVHDNEFPKSDASYEGSRDMTFLPIINKYKEKFKGQMVGGYPNGNFAKDGTCGSAAIKVTFFTLTPKAKGWTTWRKSNYIDFEPPDIGTDQWSKGYTNNDWGMDRADLWNFNRGRVKESATDYIESSESVVIFARWSLCEKDRKIEMWEAYRKDGEQTALKSDSLTRFGRNYDAPETDEEPLIEGGHGTWFHVTQ